MSSRREFLKKSSLVAIAAGLAPAVGTSCRPPLSANPVPQSVDPERLPDTLDARELATIAIEEAVAAGAVYADARLAATESQRFFFGSPPTLSESLGVGVRALINGSWGFVASGIWTREEMARLGRAATAQAEANTWMSTPPVRFDEASRGGPVAQGEWITPVVRDPFSVPVTETMDFCQSILSYASKYRNASASMSVNFGRMQKTFASSEGALCRQTLYDTLGQSSALVLAVLDPMTYRSVQRRIPVISPTSAGYEVLEHSTLLDMIDQYYEDARRQLEAVAIPSIRCDIVLDSVAMASVLSKSVGAALEVDRSLGYEANAYGTSYLSPPESKLGMQLGSKLLNLTANRTDPTGAASAKWDDEGVETHPFQLIRDGAVADYCTSREHAGGMREWYEKQEMPVRSNGCAVSDSATSFPIVRLPNLRMQPASNNMSFDDLVAQVDDGIAIVGGTCNVDQQRLSGQGTGEVMYRILNGKRGPAILGAAYLFRAPDFWTRLAAIGGEQTATTIGLNDYKGQPAQFDAHSVTAVAGIVTNQLVADVRTRTRLPTP